MGVVMFLLAGSFAVWGINDIFRGFGRSTLAKIGDTEIGIEQFRQNYNDRLQQIGQQLGHPLPPDQASALGLDRQVLGEPADRRRPLPQQLQDPAAHRLAQRVEHGVR